MIAIGQDLKASILTASLLIQLKVPVIWAKAVDDQHGRILEQLGVHRVIYPEKDMGRRVAHLVRGAAKDYLEIEPGYSLAKITTPDLIVGIPLGQTVLRRKHGVTVTVFKHAGETWLNADNETVLAHGDSILIVGPTDRPGRGLRPAALSPRARSVLVRMRRSSGRGRRSARCRCSCPTR